MNIDTLSQLDAFGIQIFFNRIEHLPLASQARVAMRLSAIIEDLQAAIDDVSVGDERLLRSRNAPHARKLVRRWCFGCSGEG